MGLRRKKWFPRRIAVIVGLDIECKLRFDEVLRAERISKAARWPFGV
jgi:hypothetical protein